MNGAARLERRLDEAAVEVLARELRLGDGCPRSLPGSLDEDVCRPFTVVCVIVLILLPLVRGLMVRERRTRCIPCKLVAHRS
jgi:hypothetical protein